MLSCRLPLAAIPLSLAACATQQPLPGSLAALHQEARQETREACLKTQFGVNRHVPTFSLVAHCDRLVRQRYGPARR